VQIELNVSIITKEMTTFSCSYNFWEINSNICLTNGSAKTSSIFFSDKAQKPKNNDCSTNSPGFTCSSNTELEPEDPDVEESGLDVDLDDIVHMFTSETKLMNITDTSNSLY